MDCRVMKHGMDRIIFDLIYDDRLIDKGAEQFDLSRGMVTDPEPAHLACPMQKIECLCASLRFDQRVRAMQQKNIQISRLQPLQNSVYCTDDVIKTQVVASRQSF